MAVLPICTQNIVIPALGVGILFNGERLEYAMEYFVGHLAVLLRLLIQPCLRNTVDLDWNRQESDHYDGVR
jgi:hypothetical protein